MTTGAGRIGERMVRVLVTGMSGTGKSAVIAELAARGYRTIDADADGFSEEVAVPAGELTGLGSGRDWVWREDRIRDLLAATGDGPLFVGGCAPNQGAFYPWFAHVVLLTAPAGSIAGRLATRTSNPFGKRPGEVERTLALLETVEPLLRRRATAVIDASAPLGEVVAALLRLVGEPSSPRSR